MYEIYMNIGNYQGKDFSNYEISNLGNVRNAKTKKVLKPRICVNNTGYKKLVVYLCDINHKGYNVTVARLVISTFKANPRKCSDVNHINENPLDNRLNNLEWMTHSENINYGTRNKRDADKKSIPVYCITNNTIYKSAREAARQLNLYSGSITRCCKGKQKSTGKGYQFKYYTEEDVQ